MKYLRVFQRNMMRIYIFILLLGMFGFIGTGCRESDIGGISTNMNIVEPEGIDSIMNLYAPPFYNNIWREKSNSVKIPANLVYKISTKRDRQATILEVKEVQ